ncbi:MAG: TIGR02147 family protein [Bdellovibrionia bacterium]
MAALKTSVFEYTSYKAYLLAWIESRPQKGRGERSRIAETLRCQLAYVSQVLNGPAHFSFEQAEALNQLLNHTDDEADFFHLLVQLERAGTPALRSRIQRKIKKILNDRLILRNRLEFEETLSREDQAIYYSSWYYAGIHVAVAIPALQTREALVRALGLPVSRVTQVLEFLVSRGLVQESKGRYSTGNTRIHLESDSPMIAKHHVNWRMQALQAVEKESADELHYSSVITASEGDIPRIREVLVKAIEQIREIVRPSQDETLYCYTLDLFSVVRDQEALL